MKRAPIKSLSSVLYVLITFTVVSSLNGNHNAIFAADDRPDNTAAQPGSLDIPGSFKDLPDAKDAVTGKRGPAGNPAPFKAAPIEIVIDADKVAAASVNRLVPRNNPVRQEAAPTVTFDELELVDFDATAYCLKGRTASGIDTRPGVIAADPRVLPIGTVVHLRAGQYTGTYTVMDTGGRIKGRRVDVYLQTHREAIQFGRRQVKIKIIGRRSTKADPANRNLEASAR